MCVLEHEIHSFYNALFYFHEFRLFFDLNWNRLHAIVGADSVCANHLYRFIGLKMSYAIVYLHLHVFLQYLT